MSFFLETQFLLTSSLHVWFLHASFVKGTRMQGREKWDAPRAGSFFLAFSCTGCSQIGSDNYCVWDVLASSAQISQTDIIPLLLAPLFLPFAADFALSCSDVYSRDMYTGSAKLTAIAWWP